MHIIIMSKKRYRVCCLKNVKNVQKNLIKQSCTVSKSLEKNYFKKILYLLVYLVVQSYIVLYILLCFVAFHLQKSVLFYVPSFHLQRQLKKYTVVTFNNESFFQHLKFFFQFSLKGCWRPVSVLSRPAQPAKIRPSTTVIPRMDSPEP